MKRYGNLWSQIISFDNLLLAARNAQKGKRFRPSILQFNYHLETEIQTLRHELHHHTYRPGGYHTFRIFDPKPRLISAAPYRDRVVHHALCNIIQPLIERSFIPDTYANRLGYGTHRALSRCIHFARHHTHVLQCDIYRYFPSIDLEILKTLLHKFIKCPETLWLIDLIIDSSNPQEPVITYFPGDTLLTPIQRRHGLPIGNLTSQFFANVYLNRFDHFVKEQLHAKCYLRYVDDFLLFSNDAAYLAQARPQIEDYLATLRLQIHPIKSQLFETRQGVNFVGFRILERSIRVRQHTLRRGRRRLKQLQHDYSTGMLSLDQLKQCLQSWEAHLRHGNTHHLRRHIFEQTVFNRTANVEPD